MKSAEGAEKYYYDKDPINKMEGSEWYGKAAKDLGLSGTVQREAFRFHLLGLDNKGNELLSRAGQAQKRAAYDMTFSAPKSVSIAALHLGDQKLVKAHEIAVRKALDLYEDHFCQYRKTQDKQTTLEQSNNIVSAIFHHTTSRATENEPIPDPQLHSHAVTMNMTKTKEGWRAIRNDALFANQVILLQEYKAILAKEVKKAGYSLEFAKGGNWELAGIKEEWIEQFSKRSAGIKKEYDKQKDAFPNLSEKALKSQIARENRISKNPNLTEKELKQGWEQQLSKENIKETLVRKPQGQNIEKVDPEEVLKKAVEAWHGKEALFTKVQLFNLAYQLGRGEITYSEMQTAFANGQDKGELLLVKTETKAQGYPKEFYTSDWMLEQEKQVVAAFKQGLEQSKPLATSLEHLNLKSLSQGQQAALEIILTGKDQFSIIQGDAGTGKTSVIRKVTEYYQNELGDEKKLMGLGFTGQAAKELKDAAGLQTSTISRYLNQKPSLEPRQYIIDESSMISSSQFAELVERVKVEESRAVFMGDGKQLAAIEAGKLFKDLQELDCCKSVKMEEVFRQTTPHMQEVVDRLKEYQAGNNPEGIKEVFQLVEDQGALHEIADSNHRFQAVVQDYCNTQDLKTIGLITAKNQDRQILNEMIRNELQEQGRVSPEEQTFALKKPYSLSGVEKSFAVNYEQGDRVFVTKNLSGVQGMSCGKEYLILDRDCENNTLTLDRGKGQTIQVDLLKDSDKLSCYSMQEKELSQGDRIMFLKNDRKLDLVNGLTGEIQDLTKENLQILLDNGDQREFPISDYQYLDYAYCSTVYKSQGQTVDKVMLVADSEAGQQNNLESFYVAMTRAKEDASLYVDNAKALIPQFEVSHEKTSTLEPDVNQQEQEKSSFQDVLQSHVHELAQIQTDKEKKLTFEDEKLLGLDRGANSAQFQDFVSIPLDTKKHEEQTIQIDPLYEK